MAQQPIAMEQIKQVLQLHSDGISIHEITRRMGMSRNTVRKYLSHFSDVTAPPFGPRTRRQSL